MKGVMRTDISADRCRKSPRAAKEVDRAYGITYLGHLSIYLCWRCNWLVPTASEYETGFQPRFDSPRLFRDHRTTECIHLPPLIILYNTAEGGEPVPSSLRRQLQPRSGSQAVRLSRKLPAQRPST